MAEFNSEDIKKGLQEYLDQLSDLESAFSSAFNNMVTLATGLNAQFTQGRERITEMNYAIAQAGPEIERLGGEVADVGRIMGAVAEATRRNVIAATEDVTKLYAAEKLIGENAERIVGSFQDVGVQFSQVGTQLEESINYVRGVGGNAKQVMGDVMRYMESMNRYNFSEGVLGLTKMATQASLLRYDMAQTLNLTEKALDPEGAIELSSAFQRLGVSAGDLVDPFQLMNKSINDPQGLQDAIVNMSKQFSYFDEKTKTFKINPQGILMMKEIEKQTGLSSKEMSKLAVNAADLDRKLSHLSPSLEFKNPEDKMYLSNIARMGEGGEYEVTINDKETKKLSEITQSELNKLIEEQKKPPKSLEDLSRDQLDVSNLIFSDLRSIRDKFVYGLTSAEIVRKELEGMRRGLSGVSGTVSGGINQEGITTKVDSLLGRMGDLASSLMRGDPGGKKIAEELKGLANEIGGYVPEMQETQREMLMKIMKDVQPSTYFERGLLEYVLKPIDEKLNKMDSSRPKQTPKTVTPEKVKSGITTQSGNIPLTQAMQTNSTNITIGGTGTPITFKIDVPPGVDKEYIEKMLNSQGFSEKISKMVLDKMKETGLVK